jgi:hypothetical protein
MKDDLQTREAILWHAGEALAEGSLSECVRNWEQLPRLLRAHSYVQLTRAAGTKAVFRQNELSRIAATALNGIEN